MTQLTKSSSGVIRYTRTTHFSCSACAGLQQANYYYVVFVFINHHYYYSYSNDNAIANVNWYSLRVLMQTVQPIYHTRPFRPRMRSVRSSPATPMPLRCRRTRGRIWSRSSITAVRVWHWQPTWSESSYSDARSSTRSAPPTISSTSPWTVSIIKWRHHLKCIRQQNSVVETFFLSNIAIVTRVSQFTEGETGFLFSFRFILFFFKPWRQKNMKLFWHPSLGRAQ